MNDTSKCRTDAERFRALAEIAEAHARGESVEYTDNDDVVSVWKNAPNPAWNSHQHYRIKPKPRVLWVTFDANGEVVRAAEDGKFRLEFGHTFATFIEQLE